MTDDCLVELIQLTKKGDESGMVPGYWPELLSWW